jgi:excinuclease ABC subunit C
MQKSELKKFKLPNSPGVYFFKKERETLYIGKATSLRDRVRSYFSNDVIKTRGPRIVDMVSFSNKVEFEKTDSVLEALILEANLIKRYEPKYNIKEKDNKSYSFVAITKDEIPKILIERGRALKFKNTNKYSNIYGPYPSQAKLSEALKIIRKIFPFISEKTGSRMYAQIGLAPNLETSKDKIEYKRNIRNIKLFLSGKKKSLVNNLNSRMKKLAKDLKFEEAEIIKRQIYSLNHINDISLISNIDVEVNSGFRIESYDIAHMNGQNSVGVMTVVENSVAKKSDYRKFILRETKRGDDVGGLKEIVKRRLKHTEWAMPDLIVVDGGKAQLNNIKKLLLSYRIDIPVVSVLKDEKHKPKEILGISEYRHKFPSTALGAGEKEILISNSEAHRFAIGFFRKRSEASFLS